MIEVNLTFDEKQHLFKFKNEYYCRLIAGLAELGVQYSIQKIQKQSRTNVTKVSKK